MRYFIMLFMSSVLAFSQGDPRNCVVALRVVDVAGRPVPYKVTSFKDRKGVDFASEFVGLRGSVPCSVFLYTVQLDQSNVSDRVAEFTKIQSRVAADTAETWLTLPTNPTLSISPDGTRVGSRTWGIPAGYVWKGRLTNLPEMKVWIHIRSAVRSDYGGGEMEAEVDATGEFRVYSAFFKGPYILYVINRGGELIYTAPVRVESELPLESIQISLTEPAKLIVIK